MRSFHFIGGFMRQLFNRLVEFDRRRPNFPGEHFIVATLGASLLRAAARRTGPGRILSLLAGAALVARAASGRGGISSLSRLVRR
jgi:hypothetical protein